MLPFDFAILPSPEFEHMLIILLKTLQIAITREIVMPQKESVGLQMKCTTIGYTSHLVAI